MTADPISFVKGHGTGNDFVILTDLTGALDLTTSRVAALCDRRRGIGADGVLVATRTAARREVADQAAAAEFFMDYRNADGSVAQMCGNGARVFVAHLRELGLIEPGSLAIATRGGTRAVELGMSGEISVDMGPPEFLQEDLTVRPCEGTGPGFPAQGVLMPNPHAVTWVDSLDQAGALLDSPLVNPGDTFPEGVNVEFVRVLAERHVALRVFERGVGETLSCGTGACAAAVATLRRAGEQPTGQHVRVDVPGGRLDVVWRPDGNVELRGPVAVVARGTIDPIWWERNV